VGVGRALGALTGVPAASLVPSTAACPSDCRGSKPVAIDSAEGYATRTSFPLLWGWPFSRQQDGVLQAFLVSGAGRPRL
jgi:hypothetical protein